MKTIYSSPLQEIYFDEDKSLIKNVWMSDDINFEQIKEEMTNWMEQFNKVNPKNMLTDNSRGLIIASETQEWIFNFLVPTVIDAGVKKYGIILSDELFSGISVEQMFDELNHVPTDEFQQLFFQDSDLADKWVSE